MLDGAGALVLERRWGGEVPAWIATREVLDLKQIGSGWCDPEAVRKAPPQELHLGRRGVWARVSPAAMQ